MSDNQPDKSQLSQKSHGSAKGDQKRVKHNRNAEEGLKLPDRHKDDAKEAEITQKLRGDRRTPKFDDTMKAKIVECRRFGHTYSAISRFRGFPTERTIDNWKKADPSFAEDCDAAYDSYMRRITEESIPKIMEIDDAPGIENDLASIIHQRWQALDSNEELTDMDRFKLALMYGETLVRHGRGRSEAKRSRVMTAVETGARKLPSEWGKDRQQDQEVIVIETPGGWMMQAATADLPDPDGQGPEALSARERWRELRDNAEDV